MRKVSLKRLIQRSGISEALREAREGTGPTMAEVAPFLGLHNRTGRYERNEMPMQVSRLIHLSEVFRFSPIDLIMAAAPYRLGKTQSQASQRRKLIKVVEPLPLDVSPGPHRSHGQAPAASRMMPPSTAGSSH
ncbi:helix-turn-helix domain-containing protein [Rhizobium yanglingense]